MAYDEHPPTPNLARDQLRHLGSSTFVALRRPEERVRCDLVGPPVDLLLGHHERHVEHQVSLRDRRPDSGPYDELIGPHVRQWPKYGAQESLRAILAICSQGRPRGNPASRLESI